MMGKKKKKKDMENQETRMDPGETGKTDQGPCDVPDKQQASQVENREVAEEEMNEQERINAGLKEQIAELNDRFLRTLAEFDNYRKRTLKERIELIQTASSEVILSLLPVLDDLDRAVNAFAQVPDKDALKEGIILVQQKFRTILQQKGLEEMKTLGEDFNTDLHEAVANVAAEKEEDKNKVIDVLQKGYVLNGKVIRFAKVVVAN